MAEEESGQTGTSMAEPVSLADANGVLREGWRETLEEDLREESYLKEVKDVQSMAKSVVSARKMVGKDKIAIPNEASSEDELDAFHRAGGRPDTAKDYNYVKPEDFPEENWNEEFATQVQEILFKGGASKQLADALFALNLSTVLNAVKAQAEANERDFKDTEGSLHRDWGNAYEQNKHRNSFRRRLFSI